ncbi:MAG: FAD-dependent oxidoreductase [candidate division NC10 bacterium]|nr:FAD-dependent oxidoreductase [candidate division NC10 bacterium]
MGKPRFEKLLEPGRIGRVVTRNRMIKSGQGTSFIEPTGYVGESAIAYYETMAKGGVGLLIVESCGVEYPLGVHHPPVQFHLDEDRYIPSYGELTRAVHRHGCPIFLQLFHAGPWNPTGKLPPRDTIASSTLAKSELPGPDFDAPRGLTPAEVKEYIDKFARAAERAQKAGFDGVELNGGTCHLINSFLSRVWNRRTDGYGPQSLENRARFMVEIVQEIKRRLGSDFPVIALINIAEYGAERGTVVEEGVGFAKLLQEAGADAIQVRAHGYGHRGGLLHPDRLLYPEPPKVLPKDLDWSRKGAGATVPLAEAVKRAVTVPVIAACRLDPELGEMCLRQGKLDFVAMTRRLLADPELPNKVISGRLEEIRPCPGCLYCMDVRLHNTPIRCRVNAALGRETQIIQPAEKKKKVVIVGGGPAGMEAARMAASRGHQVTLYEREGQLGGLIPLASLVKDLETESLLDLIRYYQVQLAKLRVTVRLGKEIGPAEIQAYQPDVVILALGGLPGVVAIPGTNHRRVISTADLKRKTGLLLRILGPRTMGRLTKFWMPMGKRVIIIGGAVQGCQLAEFLVKRGRTVTIVDTAKELGEGMTGDDKTQLFAWFKRKGVTTLHPVQYERITAKGLDIITRDGERRTLEADTLIVALPFQSNSELLDSLQGKVPELYAIGDCKEPQLMVQAIADGWSLGSMI